MSGAETARRLVVQSRIVGAEMTLPQLFQLCSTLSDWQVTKTVRLNLNGWSISLFVICLEFRANFFQLCSTLSDWTPKLYTQITVSYILH